MAPLQRKLRRALGSMKDQTSIGLAKVASNGTPELEVALVKATSHDEFPIEERYVQEILHLISYSRSYVSTCVAGLSKRMSKTHNWIVAIKALMLVHRLLQDGDPVAFEQELLYASRRGLRVLNLSNFRDDSHSHGWDYSAFVRTYALFLDERLDFNINTKPSAKGGSQDRHQSSSYDDGYGYGSHGDDYGSAHRDRSNLEQPKHNVPIKDLKPFQLLDRIPLMQRLLERILACRPTGAARMDRLVQIALYPVVRESFQIYTDLCDGLAIILDAFFDMDHADCIKAFDIHTRASKQMVELTSFYSFCKNLGVCRSSEYPAVQRITEELLETMEDFLRGRSDVQRERRKPSPDPKPRSPEREQETDLEVNGMKALPAPPVVEEVEPEPQAPLPPPQETEPDLLGFDNETISAEEHGDRLALALFSDGVPTTQSEAMPSSNGGFSSGDRPLAGWELALVESASEISKPSTNKLAGGFDNLLLTSMYDQAVDMRKMVATYPSGSASSVALPGQSASSFLALPAPAGNGVGDPFAASLTVPPPPYVQMSDMKQKQHFLVQEQQVWYHYQRDGMQGYNGLMKYYNNGYNHPLQTVYPVPYYGTSQY